MDKQDTAVIYVRMDKELKNKAENILNQLGISPSAAIHMLYSQVLLTNGFPLDLKLPENSPTSDTDVDINKTDTNKKSEKLADTTKEIKKEKAKESSDKTDTETTNNSATPVYRPGMPFIVKPKRKG